jgi:hypothetical protein
MGFPVGAAIAAGGKLLGGILGNRRAKKAAAQARAQALQDTLNRGVYAREAAERGGFNPLTMLGVGGGVVAGSGSGYGYDGGAAPLASALSSAVDIIADEISPETQERREFNKLLTELTRLELDKARALAPVYAAGASFATSGALTGGRAAVQATQAGQSYTAAGRPAVEVYNPDRQSVEVGGIAIKPDKGWSDAQEIEDRYGDAVSWLYGIGVATADFIQTNRSEAVGGPQPVKTLPMTSGALLAAPPVWPGMPSRVGELLPGRPADKPKPKLRDYFTHNPTGFSAARY